MVGTVAARPTHYETLGIAPGASSSTIAEAFANELRKPRRFGDLGRISTAFETLSDPIRREAYDAAIGLTRRPKPVPTSGSVSASFLCPPAPFVQDRPAPAPVRQQEPPTAPAPLPEPEPEEPWTPELTTIAPLRIVETPPQARPATPARPRDSARSEVEAWAAANRPARYQVDEEDDGASPRLWRTGAALGGLVAGVVLLGAWAGWESGNDNPLQLQQIADAGASNEPEPAPVSEAETEAVETAAPPPERPAVVTRLASRNAPDRVVSASTAPASADEPVTDATELAASLDPLAPAPALKSASMPLPNSVVARTIDRIGYSCGQVTSTAALGGAGVYKVTCSSGQSFRAAPVGGRYRFRRL